MLALLLLLQSAQGPDPLRAFVDEALAANRGLLQTRLAERESQAGVRRARGLLLPSLGLDLRWTEQNGGLDLGELINPAYAALNEVTGEARFPTDLSVRLPFRQDFRARVIQPLFDPSALAAQGLAAARNHVARAETRLTARTIAAAAQLAYLSFASASRGIGVLESAARILEENLRVSERLVASGTATPDAVSRARADLAETTQAILDATRDREAALRRLNELLARPLARPVALLPDSLLGFPDLPPLDTALASARAHHEGLDLADATIRMARADRRLAGAGFLPSIAVAAEYGFTGNDLRVSRDNDVAAGAVIFQWNLFRGGSDRARRDEATLALERARLAREEHAAAIEREARDAWQAAAAAREAVGTALTRLEAAERTFELVRRRYEEGLATHLEFTEARSALTAAGLNATITRYQAAARYVELERAAALRVLDT
jgi:outer membrane protein TolC